MKKSYALIFFFTYTWQFAYPYYNITNDHFIINGRVDGDSINSRITILVFENVFNPSNSTYRNNYKSYSIPVQSGIFKFKTNISKSSYIQIIPDWNRKSILAGKYLLIRSKDNIHLEIKNDKLKFTGIGSTRLNFELHQKGYENLTSSYAISDPNYISEYISVLDSVYAANCNKLNNVKKKISIDDYHILKVDMLGERNIAIFRFLILGNLYYIKHADIKTYLIQFCKNSSNFIGTENSKLLIKSCTYSYFAYRLQFLLASFSSIDNEHKTLVCSNLYKRINENYNGLFRQKLITLFFKEFIFEGVKNLPQMLNDALRIVNHKKYKSILLVVRNTTPGFLAYNFSLQDTSGNLVRLGNFKKRTILIDFWFSGCYPCSKLSELLNPIIDSLRNDTNLIFISICIDKDKAKWKQSVISGKYTSPNEINLFTNGYGTEHPLIQYYNYTGFPQLLIVRHGLIISGNPPWPLSSDRKAEFLKLLVSDPKENHLARE